MDMQRISQFVLLVLLLSCTQFANGVQLSQSSTNAQTSSIVLHNGWLYFKNTNGDVISRERISDIRSIVFTDNTQSGIQEIEIPENNIRIYPNPVQETLNIESNESVSYKIFDLDGRLLLNGEGNSIGVSSLKTGTYLLQINNNTLKFIKQ
ncbi:MAG: T9SS type A sorting domain-containing protein [Paludibacteraceae bacterium]|nr:T9SS type A sorting domain-containing protein [Paludibacteraceae bacterium]